MNIQNNSGHPRPQDDRPTEISNCLNGSSLPTTVKGGSFDIRDHWEKLTPAEGKKGKYICPVCEDDNFSFNPKDGAFQCWSTGCKTTDIIKAIAPLPPRDRRQRQTRPKKTTKQKQQAVAHVGIAVDSKVTELVYQVESGSMSKGEALTTIAAWAKEEGVDGFAAKVSLQEKLKELEKRRPPDSDLKLKRAYLTIEREFSSRLRFNDLTKQVELDGEEFDPSTAKIFFEIDHDIELKANQEAIAAMVIRLAKQNTYHPVAEYLQSVSDRYGDDISILENLAARYFGSVEYIHEVMLYRWLISCVARAMKPGCKADSALILQGKQGCGKSSFFSTLASQEWFGDDYCSDSNNKDEKLKIHLVWMMEWGELERVFKRNDLSKVKAFITTRDDLVRPPYGRKTERMKRSSVIVGSTNEQQFLVDTTGNRRFWVIPVTQQIDIEQLAKERDQIWAAAVHCYRSGESHDLVGEENAIAAENRTQYEYKDAWYDDIAGFVEFKDAVSLAEIFARLEIDVSRKDAAKNKRVGNVLTQLGFVAHPYQQMHNGHRQRIWKKEFTPKL